MTSDPPPASDVTPPADPVVPIPAVPVVDDAPAPSPFDDSPQPPPPLTESRVGVGDIVLFHVAEGFYRPAMVLTEPGSDPNHDRGQAGNALHASAQKPPLPAPPLQTGLYVFGGAGIVNACEGTDVLCWSRRPASGSPCGTPPVPGGREGGPPVDVAAVTAADVRTQRVEEIDRTIASLQGMLDNPPPATSDVELAELVERKTRLEARIRTQRLAREALLKGPDRKPKPG